jgi:hypothetical protein
MSRHAIYTYSYRVWNPLSDQQFLLCFQGIVSTSGIHFRARFKEFIGQFGVRNVKEYIGASQRNCRFLGQCESSQKASSEHSRDTLVT